MRRPLVAALLLGAAAVAGCTTAPAPGTTAAPAPEPPPPPAACVLDVAALGAATGLTWAVDETTASDTRCVYDPRPGTDFVAVEVLSSPPASSGPAPASVDTLAQACAADTRVPSGTDGFVCRFPGGGVFAVRDRAGVVVTVAAAEVPAGSTAEQLAAAFVEQLATTG